MTELSQTAPLNLLATCPKGIEGLLADELTALGAEPGKTTVAGGRNYWGGLGQNESEGAARSSPIQVPGSWSSVSLTYLGSLGLKTNGTLWGWGQNDSGQLGQNNTTKRSSPVQVGSDTDWTLINSHFHGSLAIKEIG